MPDSHPLDRPKHHGRIVLDGRVIFRAPASEALGVVPLKWSKVRAFLRRLVDGSRRALLWWIPDGSRIPAPLGTTPPSSEGDGGSLEGVPPGPRRTSRCASYRLGSVAEHGPILRTPLA